MAGIIMPALQAYTQTLGRIADSVELCRPIHVQNKIRERIGYSLAFYQATMTAPTDMMRSVSFEAAKNELRVAAELLDAHAKGAKDFKPISL